MKCAICGSRLHGVTTKGSKVEKRPTRMFAGVLCHRCVRELVSIKTKIESKMMEENDVNPKFLPFLKKMK